MSNTTIIKPSEEDKIKISEELKKATDQFIRFRDFQHIKFEATLTITELKEVTRILETAEAFLALESRPLEFEQKDGEVHLQGCIECGKTDEPIIGQCEKCGGAIRACCPDHQANC